jgi:hypothetical protein
MERRFVGTFDAYGAGWRGPSARGVLPFDDQIRTIRNSGMSVNWDHFPSLRAYASDRLPISLIAGRVHITTRHPDMDWLPGSERGLIFVDSWREAVDAANDVARWGDVEVEAAGRAAFAWIKGRLSDREAARYLLGERAGTTTLPADPWTAIERLVES